MIELQETRKSQVFERDYPWVKYESFLPVAGIELAVFQKGFLSEYNTFFGKILDTKISDAKAVLDQGAKTIECHRRHLVEGKNFDEDCSLVQ